ncbi:hypothetical protein ABIB81_009599 [Bradyrhizobium sp. I1.7.5]
MCKSAITHQDLSAKVLAAVRTHQGCELVKEIAITPVSIVDSSTTWHASLVDSGAADPRLAASVLRQVSEELEPMFTLVGPHVAEDR